MKDKNKNIYKFSEIYIDEKKKKIIGSDAKIFFNDDKMKEDPKIIPGYLQIVLQFPMRVHQFKFLPTALLEKMKNVRLGN